MLMIMLRKKGQAPKKGKAVPKKTKSKTVFSVVNQDVSVSSDNQQVNIDDQPADIKAGTAARGKKKGRTASGGGSKAAASSRNSKIKPNRVSLNDDEKENGKKNGETSKTKAIRGGLGDKLSSRRRSGRSNNQPIRKYKDEEDIEEDEKEEEDEIEEYDESDQSSDDDSDHGGRKYKKARK
jgi:hypothetical protein